MAKVRDNFVFDPSMEFREFLRNKRKMLGMNQTQLAEKLGVNQGTISVWEMGVTSPPIDEAAYIVKRLGGEIQIINLDEVRNERE